MLKGKNMKILVCIRQGLDGNINPFDACAYEEALRIRGAEVTILSMGPLSAKNFLHSLTRLGAKKAILLSDKAFAGSDTLATAYALSKAVKMINPDLIFCGRQTLVGDTAQTGPMLSVFTGFSLITNVMSIDKIDTEITCSTRNSLSETVKLPALLTIERINDLRLPSIMSRLGDIEVLSATDIDADIERCGLIGSPTRVLKTFENESGKRKCKFINLEDLPDIIASSIKKNNERIDIKPNGKKLLKKVCVVGEAALSYAQTISDDIILLKLSSAENLVKKIKAINPSVVLWESDFYSKKISAQVAAMLNLGLCADCTSLETDGKELIMYRPALSGSIIAKIVSTVKPAMATVRTVKESSDILISAGFGVRDKIDEIKSFANAINADIVTTRKMVDNNILPYSLQVGLTGKTVCPAVYIAIGVSGAVHHIVGMQQSATIIAINPDKNAPIFDYADYGIITDKIPSL